MRYILDTHTAFWFLKGSSQLSDKARKAIESAELNAVSIASAWEIAIKSSIGKLSFNGGVQEFLNQVKRNGFTVLPIKEEHLAFLHDLPFIHRDPFDRLLVSSALAEGMAIITADENIHKYPVPCIW